MHLKDLPEKRSCQRWQVCKVTRREEAAGKNKEGESRELLPHGGAFLGRERGEFPAPEEGAGCRRAVFLLIPFKDPSGRCCCLVVKGSTQIISAVLVPFDHTDHDRSFSSTLFCPLSPARVLAGPNFGAGCACRTGERSHEPWLHRELVPWPRQKPRAQELFARPLVVAVCRAPPPCSPTSSPVGAASSGHPGGLPLRPLGSDHGCRRRDEHQGSGLHVMSKHAQDPRRLVFVGGWTGCRLYICCGRFASAEGERRQRGEPCRLLGWWLRWLQQILSALEMIDFISLNYFLFLLFLLQVSPLRLRKTS